MRCLIGIGARFDRSQVPIYACSWRPSCDDDCGRFGVLAAGPAGMESERAACRLADGVFARAEWQRQFGTRIDYCVT